MPAKGEGTITMVHQSDQLSKKPYAGAARQRGRMFGNEEETQEATDAKLAAMKHPLLSKNQSGVKKRPSQFEPADRQDQRGEDDTAKAPQKRSESYFGRFNRFLGLSQEQPVESARKASSSQRKESPTFHQTPERKGHLSPGQREPRQLQSDEKPVNIMS